MKESPKVKIDRFMLDTNGVSLGRKHWSIDTILRAVEGLPEYDLQLSAIDLNVSVWRGGVDSIYEFIWQMNRVNNADLSYPIIQTPWGYICDGWHRVCKAVLQGDTTIKAVRLVVMPDPDSIDPETK
jgi:hypothetical protein